MAGYVVRRTAAVLTLVLTGCVHATTPAPDAAAGVANIPERETSEACQSSSPECRRWTELAKLCEENLRQRDAGFMGRQEPYCTQAEEYREAVTGVADSTAPGAHRF